MAILWYDGFDQYGDGAASVGVGSLYSDQASSVSNVRARTGASSMAFGISAQQGQLRRSLGGDFSRVGVAMGWFFENLPIAAPPNSPFSIVDFRSVDNFSHVSIQVGTTGRIVACRSTTVGIINGPEIILGSSEKELAPGTWNHIEVWVTADETTGTVQIWVNGILYLSLTGQDTLSDAGNPVANPFISQVAFGNYGIGIAFGGTWYLDDVVAMNDNATAADGSASPVTGAAPLGQYGVYTLLPNADTTDATWAKSTGANGFSLINEVPPDGDSTFLFTGTVNAVSRFATGPLPANVVAVAAVMNSAMMRKTDTGNCNVTLGVKSSATTKLGQDEPLTTGYGYQFSVFEQDPSSAAPWNPVVLPTIEAKRTA